jgi:Tol biopolymer transport system component
LIGEPATLADDVRMILLPARRLIFSTSAAGATMAYQSGRLEARLVWFDRSGRELGSVGEAGNMSTLGLSHDGSRIAFGLVDPRTGVVNLWVTDIRRGVTTRLTAGALRESSPAWSPQDDQIAFHAFREDGKHLYAVAATGGEPRQLLRSTGPTLNLDDWSRDGRYILYHETETRQMLALELGGQHRKVLVARGVNGPVMTALATPDEGVFSPDGAFVAFNIGTTGRSEVFLKRFPPTDEQWQISNAGGMQPRWRADGRELFYLAPDGTMMVVDITSLRPTFKAGAPRRLFKTRVTPGPGTEQYAVTGDGQRFLIMDPVADEQSLPLRVIVDWPGLIARR